MKGEDLEKLGFKKVTCNTGDVFYEKGKLRFWLDYENKKDFYVWYGKSKFDVGKVKDIQFVKDLMKLLKIEWH